MCGIFGYIGKRDAETILLDGLTSLEYRGYDSAGMYTSKIGLVKAVGAVKNLKDKLSEVTGVEDSKKSSLSKKSDSSKKINGSESGIAHIRWATHGEPTEKNAHPHTDCSKNFYVVHNGIVENYQEIKDRLKKAGHRFVSETDTEVIPHLIEEHLKKIKDQADSKNNFEQAVKSALREIRGTYGLAIASKKDPGIIIAARMGAPVVVGIGEHAGKSEHFIASDPSPILRHTKQVIYLHDGEIAVLTADSHDIYTLDNEKVQRDAETIEWNVDAIKKDGYDHFMLKEIMEGSEVVKNTIRGRLVPEKGLVKLGGLDSVAKQIRDIDRIIIVGCGTAYYSGLVGEYMIEEYAGIPVEVEIGSEFRYRKPLINKRTMLLAISQSGETADTLEAIREAKRKGALTIGIVNTVGSTIARETDAGMYNHAGPEVGVASTKAFISQLTALSLLTIFLGRERDMSVTTGEELARAIATLPEKITELLKEKNKIKALAKKYSTYDDFLYIGRKYNYPIAFEGALKLKEVSYVHAEGYGAGEMKHGPLAMIDETFPTVAIALSDSVYQKIISNIQEIKARKGKVLAIATAGDTDIKKLVDDVIYIPECAEFISPILAIIPLQLFAYYFAVERKLNVDRPRNLAKSVTVE